jgi:hypothetical protein
MPSCEILIGVSLYGGEVLFIGQVFKTMEAREPEIRLPPRFDVFSAAFPAFVPLTHSNPGANEQTVPWDA